MNSTKWLIIVRRGATDQFERLTAQFADKPDVAVQFDRRVGQRRARRPHRVDDPRNAERRTPEDPRLIIDGWFMVEAGPPPTDDRDIADSESAN